MYHAMLRPLTLTHFYFVALLTSSGPFGVMASSAIEPT